MCEIPDVFTNYTGSARLVCAFAQRIVWRIVIHRAAGGLFMIRSAVSTAIVLVSGLLVGRPARAIGAQDRPPPDFRVQIWGEVSADFSQRIRSYADLRTELERDLPPLRGTDHAAEIIQRERELARRIRAARAKAREGDIFTPAVSTEFRKTLQTQTNAVTCQALLDDNPGALPVRINGSYPEHKPLSTMAPNVLEVLPRLPADIEYRFLGRHLILIDTRAQLLVDRMTSAIQCR